MEIDWQPIIAAVLGSGVTVAAAKYFVTNTLSKIDSMPGQMAEIHNQLSIIKVRLEMLDRLQGLIQHQGDQLANMNVRVSLLENKRVSGKRTESHC